MESNIFIEEDQKIKTPSTGGTLTYTLSLSTKIVLIGGILIHMSFQLSKKTNQPVLTWSNLNLKET